MAPAEHGRAPGGRGAGRKAHAIYAKGSGKASSISNYDRHLDMDLLSEHIMRAEIVDRVVSILGPDVLCWRFGGTITARTAFTKSTKKNGCLQLRPGTHRVMNYDELKGMAYDRAWISEAEMPAVSAIPSSGESPEPGAWPGSSTASALWRNKIFITSCRRPGVPERLGVRARRGDSEPAHEQTGGGDHAQDITFPHPDLRSGPTA